MGSIPAGDNALNPPFFRRIQAKIICDATASTRPARSHLSPRKTCGSILNRAPRLLACSTVMFRSPFRIRAATEWSTPKILPSSRVVMPFSSTRWCKTSMGSAASSGFELRDSYSFHGTGDQKQSIQASSNSEQNLNRRETQAI